MIGARIALLASLLGAPSVPAPQAPAEASGSFGGLRVSATWTFPSQTAGGGKDFAFADVYQQVTDTDGRGVAIVGLGTCILVHAGDTTRSCRGGGFAHEIVPGEFELSPTLDMAQLEYTERLGGHQQVIWTAAGDPPVLNPSYGASSSGVAAAARVSRRAVATGEVIGVDVGRATDQASSLSRGGGGGATLSSDRASRPRIRGVRPDGWVEVTFTR